MKKIIFLLLAVPVLVATSFAQGIKLPSSLSVFTKSTGLTTGNTCTMCVQNDAVKILQPVTTGSRLPAPVPTLPSYEKGK